MPTTTLLKSLIAQPRIGPRLVSRAGDVMDSAVGHADSGYWAIESGTACIFARGPSGQRFFLTLAGPGTALCTNASRFLGVNDSIISIESITDLSLRRFSSLDWDRLTLKHPEANRAVIAQASELLNIVQYHLTQHCRRDNLERTRFALWSYARHLGTPANCGRQQIKVSRGDLAKWIGVSNDRITRLVRQLHEADEIVIRGRSILINPALTYSIAKQLPLRRNSYLTPVTVKRQEPVSPRPRDAHLSDSRGVPPRFRIEEVQLPS